jgi:hypothetical protein
MRQADNATVQVEATTTGVDSMQALEFQVGDRCKAWCSSLGARGRSPNRTSILEIWDMNSSLSRIMNVFPRYYPFHYLVRRVIT